MLSRVMRCRVALQAIPTRLAVRPMTREFTNTAIPFTQPVPENWDKVLFPSRSVGCDPDLNWSLCLHQIAPQHNAHRNLDVDSLVARGADAKKLGETSADESQKAAGFLFFDPTAPKALVERVAHIADPRYSAMPPIRYKKLSTKVFESLGQSKELYVHDFVAYVFNIRVITDSPTSALFLHNLSRSDEASDAMEFASDASVVYHASRLDALGEGIKLGRKEFSVLDPTYNTVVVGGTASNPTLLDSVSALIHNNCSLTRKYSDSDVVAVQGNAVSSALGSTLVLGAHSAVQSMSTLSASHVVVLDAGSVFPVFPAPKSSAEPEVRELPKLANVVLVVDDATRVIPPLSQLNGQQLLHHFFVGPSATAPLSPCFSSIPISAHEHATAFTNAVVKAGANVFLVNKTVVGDTGVKQLIKAVSQGCKGKFVANELLGGLQVATSFDTIDSSLLQYSTTSDKVKASAQQRADALLSFHLAVKDDVLAGAIKAN